MTTKNSYTSAELKEIKNPSPNLHKNPQNKLSSKEFKRMILTSKGFTSFATVVTFGLYYIYYLFCIEQETDHPFVTNKKENYRYERPEDADPVYQEAKKLNKRICRLSEGKAIRETPKEFLEKRSLNLWEKLKFNLSMLSSYCSQLVERAVMYLTRKEDDKDAKEKLIQKSVQDWDDYDKKIKSFFNKKIQVLSKDPDTELDLANSLAVSLANENIKPKKDHYLTLVFWVTYVLLSLVTLGLFPFYHLVVKKRWSDFEYIRDHKEHAYLREFDNVTDKLLGTNGNIEYSYLLLSKNRLPLNLNFFSDVFRTKVFKSTQIRKNIVTFLMIVTLGLFGVFVLSKSAFDKYKLSIDADDAAPTDYVSKDSQLDRFKLFVIDLVRDIKVASKIAARRASTINNSIKSLLVVESQNDMVVIRFIKLLSSELFFWLFAFFSVFMGITIMSLYVSWYPSNFYYSFWFWFSALVIGTYWILFTRHINLLFI